MAGVGGLDALKAWLMTRITAFSAKAREYGLPWPKGMLVLGIPGCGKSLLAKCVATAWDLPLLRLDIGALFGKYIGDSEGRTRKALQTAEAVAPCILWVDEIEKGLSGLGGGDSDGGTTSRVFGTFLTWMQERKEGVFIIATSNDISKLPPELLRSGRWDDIWFVDLPTYEEREAIAKVMSNRYSAASSVDVSKIADASDTCTGAEIEQAFIDAMYNAFSDDSRPVKTSDICQALKERVPLSVTMKEKLDGLRTWAKGRARQATVQTKASVRTKRRAIE
jgi:SpoVK/Ycf46/Vps4 family AAA+-type ATPase